MAPTSTARRARPATPKNGQAKKTVKKKAVKEVGKAAVKAATPGASVVPKPKRLMKTAAKKTLQAAARKSAGLIRQATEGVALAGRNAIDSGVNHRFLPIQLSIDVAAPINVAWKEWVTLGSLPEGVHRIEDVERDGDSLFGHTAGPRAADWEAEITDERQDESFAWRSIEGSDCAGLVTFHRLSDRLTRIELDLDVVPTNPSEAMTLALHVAHRRAEADLRRFKAHVEFINPDVYESNGSANGKGRRKGGKPKSGEKAEDAD
jgi:uncharacterized membrane protein